MNTSNTKFKDFFNKYKYLLIPSIPLLFFVGLLFFIPSTQTDSTPVEPKPQINPTVVPSRAFPTKIPTPYPTTAKEEFIEEEDLSTRPGLISKDALPDGTTKYTFASTNQARPNIFIAYNAHETLFQRDVILSKYPVKITDYTKQFGQPERTISGSFFYGSNTQTLIYAQEGLAIVGNIQTNQVYEQHIFEPMTPAMYIQKYGDDIPVDKR